MPSTFSFPGLESLKSLAFTFTPGIRPSVCTITTHISAAENLSDRGDLILSDGENVLRFPDCRVERPSIRTSGGTNLRIPIFDRRWRWEFGEISGSYNVKQPDGTFLREKTPRELATLCFEAMGEVGFDVSRLPNGSRPEVDWAFDNPAQALDRICGELGCLVNLNAARNIAEIWPVGGARGNFPNSPVKGGGDSLSIEAKPKTIKVVGGRTRFEHEFEIGGFAAVPLGIEIDGSLRAIWNLSYAPNPGANLGGWSTVSSHFYEIQGGYVDPESGEQRLLKDLAKAGIWRIYEISTNGIVPALLNGTPLAPQSIEDLEILSDRVSLNELPDGRKKRRPAEISGRRYVYDLRAGVGNVPGTFDVSFSIDDDRKVVVFGEPVYLYSNNELAPAEGKLLTSYHAGRDGVFHQYTRERDIGGESGVRIVDRPDMIQEIRLDGADNVGDLNNEADEVLDAVQGEYDPQPSATREYAGLEPQATDGLIRQVSWAFSSSGTTTTISAAAVHNPAAKDENQKRAEARANG